MTLSNEEIIAKVDLDMKAAEIKRRADAKIVHPTDGIPGLGSWIIFDPEFPDRTLWRQCLREAWDQTGDGEVWRHKQYVSAGKKYRARGGARRVIGKKKVEGVMR